MSILKYDGKNHTLRMFLKTGKSGGEWFAYNNIDRKFAKAHYHSELHLRNGAYAILDAKAPFYHDADADGPYGLYGIIRFNYPGHPGVGVHSGRARAVHSPGPQHATHGCIRTTDAAMAAIKSLMAQDSLTTIEVFGNSLVTATHGKMKMSTIVSPDDTGSLVGMLA